jgi:hypothetical protein
VPPRRIASLLTIVSEVRKDQVAELVQIHVVQIVGLPAVKRGAKHSATCHASLNPAWFSRPPGGSVEGTDTLREQVSATH